MSVASKALQESVDAEITTLVTAFCIHDDAELEISFCSENDNNSKNGVPFAIFNKLFQSLSNAAQNGKLYAVEKTAMIDFFFAGNIRTRYLSGKAPVSIVKTRLSKFDVLCPERPNINIRFNLKNEVPLEKNLIPKIPPLFVRLQESWQFLYDGRYEYTLKKTVSGVSKQEACKQTPSYEIELEVVRKKEWLENTTSESIAENIKHKVIDICGRYTQDGQKHELSLIPKIQSNAPKILRKERRKFVAAKKRREQRKRKAAMKSMIGTEEEK
jgi:hypothetical protein